MRRYLTVDVFTDTQFAGNPLAVVLDADGLTSEQMQTIAREFNYSETSFVLSPGRVDSTAKVRIFTPQMEVPFAGHPNVGTAFLLARHDPRIVGAERLTFEEQAGLVHIRLLREKDAVIGAEVVAPEPVCIGRSVGVERVADSLSLKPADISCRVHEPTFASVGLPFLIAELKDRDALARCRVDAAAFWQLFPTEGSDGIFVYCRSGGEGAIPSSVAARMFFHGLFEDPATGSAAAAMAGLLASFAAPERLEAQCLVLQGEDMGRLSRITVGVSKSRGYVGPVLLSGRCAEVMEGSLLMS